MEKGRRGAARETSPGLGKGDPASATDLLCKPLPLSCLQFPYLNTRQEQ